MRSWPWHVARERILELAPAGLVLEQDVIAAVDADEAAARNLAGDAYCRTRIHGLFARDLEHQRGYFDLLEPRVQVQICQYTHEAAGDFLAGALALQFGIPVAGFRR